MIQKALIAVAVAGAATIAVAFRGAPTSASIPTVPADQVSRAYLHSFNLPSHGVALEGFSPVSYFDGVAERGDALFAVEHNGVTYHLTGADQVATFQANPAKFEPALGGWCAFGMAVQDKFPVDPTNFKIVDGQVFLFLRNAGVDALELWNGKEEGELLEQARAHWSKVSG